MLHDSRIAVVNLDMRCKKGFSFIELMIVIAVIAILASVTVPKLNDQLKLAHETAVIEQIRTIHSMEAHYYSQFGRFAGSLTELGPPPAGAGLIPRSLAEGRKSGYLIEVHPAPGGYTVTAAPEAFDKTGRRTFFSDETHVIRQNWSVQPADANSSEI